MPSNYCSFLCPFPHPIPGGGILFPGLTLPPHLEKQLLISWLFYYMLTFNRIMQRNRGSAISSRFLILINLIDPIYSINYQSGLSLPPKNGLVTKHRCLSLVSLFSLLFALCCFFPGLASTFAEAPVLRSSSTAEGGSEDRLPSLQKLPLLIGLLVDWLIKWSLPTQP